MLEDVYVAKKRNKFGEPYGFVKFSNVRDITKMTKALNAVWFGQFRVRASVARFDRNNTGAIRRSDAKQTGMVKGVEEVPLKHDGNSASVRQAVIATGGVVPSIKRGGAGDLDPEKEGTGPPKGVQVGDIVIQLGDCQKHVASIEGQKSREERVRKDSDLPADASTGRECSIFLRNYRSKAEDVHWAHKGIVATVINGEAVPMVQSRITDAGFTGLVVTPMGADKVFVRSMEGGDAMSIVEGAEEFFKLVFSNWTRWDRDGRPYHRGAWVRLYGVPLCAWNVDFFKLCVFECGRFLRVDSCSADKDRLDFARVLIATPVLDIVNKTERLLVDGAQVEIKIVEEWGYAMGEDTCLFEEENGSEASPTDVDVGYDGQEGHRDVDLLIEKLAGEGRDKDAIDSQGKCAVIAPNVPDDCLSDGRVNVTDDEWNEEILGPVLDRVEIDPGEPRVQNLEPGTLPQSQVSLSPPREGEAEVGFLPSCTRATSCPPSENRHAWKGPWSWEWMRDHNHESAGVIFSASKRAKKGGPNGGHHMREGQAVDNSRKVGGVLRHPVHNLKKIARLPSKDRGEVLKALGKCVRRRRSGDRSNPASHASSEESSVSGTGNNDWTNWVAVHGNDQMVVDDVCGIGKTIGVSFMGDKENMFQVLSRAGNGKKETAGQRQGKRARKEKSL
jgi:hypothetical protein